MTSHPQRLTYRTSNPSGSHRGLYHADRQPDAWDITVTWDNGASTVLAGTIVDIPPGSPLEDAYGPRNLVPLTDEQAGSSAGTDLHAGVSN